MVKLEEIVSDVSRHRVVQSTIQYETDNVRSSNGESVVAIDHFFTGHGVSFLSVPSWNIFIIRFSGISVNPFLKFFQPATVSAGRRDV
jgi:hypothetical protein